MGGATQYNHYRGSAQKGTFFWVEGVGKLGLLPRTSIGDPPNKLEVYKRGVGRFNELKFKKG